MPDDVFRIRDIAARRGERAQGFLALGETPVGPISVPVVIVNGSTPGPTLCLTAGVHAAEYPGIDAVLRTIQALDPATLRGTVIAVPVVNTLMFQQRVGFLNPIDGLNLNRTAPGGADGSVSERLAHMLHNEVILRAQYHIDCHGGDLGEILWPYAGYALTGNADQDREGETIARLYSPRIVALYQSGSRLNATPGSITTEAAKRGVVAMLAESGSNGTLEEHDVQVHLNGIQNVMRYLGMVPGEPVVRGHQLRALDQFIVSATRGGLVRLKIAIGEEIQRGQEIAEICNVFGEVVEHVRSPKAGIARLIWAYKAINTGEPIVKCWETEPAPPLETVGHIQANA
jgi:predicted deacylase